MALSSVHVTYGLEVDPTFSWEAVVHVAVAVAIEDLQDSWKGSLHSWDKAMRDAQVCGTVGWFVECVCMRNVLVLPRNALVVLHNQRV